MHYLFIVNNYLLGDKEYEGKEITDNLLIKEHWVFSQAAPNIKKLGPQDEVIVYVAGRTNRYFYAYFKILDEIKDAILTPSNKFEKYLYSYFPLSCPIKVINVWANPLNIIDVKDDLVFITDKKNYGLFLRQSTKVIGESDFKLIVNKANKKTN